jgi:hypothetical protein
MALLTRPLASAAAVALLALALLALLPDCASACTCAVPPGSQQELAKRALNQSTAVFAGEVIDVEKGLPSSSVTFQVSEVWKGKQRETRTVSTPRYGSSCGYSFKEGQEYLVYAYWGPQGSPPRPALKTDICTETKPLSEAGSNLRVLGEGQGSGGEPLPDTSGGVGGLGVVGLAAVAAGTAALLVVKRLLKSG